MSPKVSVIIPVYNVENYLERCIDSVCGQNFSDTEIILVDDGSTDGSGKLCDVLAQKDSRIRVIHQENGGLSVARNTGLANASGQWISFIDSDDWIEKSFLENLIKEAEKNQCGIVGCNYRRVSEKQQYDYTDKKYNLRIFKNQEIMSNLIDNRIQQVVWNKLYKKTLLDDTLFEKGKYHEDEFWSYQVFAKVNKYVELDYIGYNYFQRADSIMGEQYSLKRLHAVEAKVQRQNFFEKNMPEMISKGRINLAFACFYHGQLALEQLNREEQKLALKYLKHVAKDYGLDRKEFMQLSMSHKFWVLLSKISYVIVCRMRNFCKVGL